MRWRAPELVAPWTLEDIESYVPELTTYCDIYSFGGLMLYVRAQSSSDHMSLG